MLCDYGCGKEAKFQMSSGKWCCESHYSKCTELRRKNRKNNLKGKIAIPFENNENFLCDYGCGKLAKYIFKNNKKCCSISDNLCEEKTKKISKSNTGKIRSIEFKKIQSNIHRGKPSGMKGKNQTEYCKIFNRNRLKNGEAKRLNEMDQRNMLKLRFAGRKTSTKSADTDLIAENDAV